MKRRAAIGFAVVALVAFGSPSAAQDLRSRLDTAPAGDVTFRFTARAGVCGDGEVIVRQRPGSGTSISFVGDVATREGRDFDHLDTWCRPGPVYVTLRRTGRELTGVRLSVGAAPPAAHELGEVPAVDAVAWLVGDLARANDRRIASRALHAASLAAAETWRPLLELAHDGAVDEKVRRNAVHWLAVEAADRLVAGLPPFDEPTELRRHAVFALSRRDDEPSRHALRALAGAGTEPAIRSAAVYWLGISDEPDALRLLEAVLRGG